MSAVGNPDPLAPKNPPSKEVLPSCIAVMVPQEYSATFAHAEGKVDKFFSHVAQVRFSIYCTQRSSLKFIFTSYPPNQSTRRGTLTIGSNRYLLIR